MCYLLDCEHVYLLVNQGQIALGLLGYNLNSLTTKMISYLMS